MSSEIELYWRECERIINNYNLYAENNYGVFMVNKIGDVYFTVSSISYVQKKYNLKFFLIVRPDSPQLEVIQAHNNNGANINYIVSDVPLYDIFWRNHDILLDKYKDKIIEDINECKFAHLITYKADESIKANYTRAKYIFEDSQEYILSLGIPRNKTVLIIPEASWHGTLPVAYWKLAISFFRMLGYKIVINSKRKIYGEGEDIKYIFPNFKHMVPLADYCGVVFAIRTGLSEAVALETKARVIIHSSFGTLKQFYPYVDESNHFYIDLPGVKTFGSPLVDNEVNEILNSRIAIHKIADRYINNLFSISDYNYPQLYSDVYPKLISGFDKRVVKHEVDRLGVIGYALKKYENNLLLISLKLKFKDRYKINIGLIDCKTNSMIGRYRELSFSNFAIQIPYPSIYKLFMKVHDIFTNKFYNLETKKFIFNITPIFYLNNCVNYADYVNFLHEHLDNIIILIVSRDAHTNYNRSFKLNLEKLGITINPDHLFRTSFITVIDRRKVLYENYLQNLPLQYSFTKSGHRFELLSTGYDAVHSPDAPVSIKIDNIEYAVNKRGLNFVVLDAISLKVIDSVAFDTFLSTRDCYRTNLFAPEEI